MMKINLFILLVENYPSRRLNRKAIVQKHERNYSGFSSIQWNLIKNLQSQNEMKTKLRFNILCLPLFHSAFDTFYSEDAEEKLWKWKKIVVAVASVLFSRLFFLLFKIDNVEMIKCRYATTTKQQQQKLRKKQSERERRKKKNHPLFWLMLACQLREFLYIFDTVLKDTSSLLCWCTRDVKIDGKKQWAGGWSNGINRKQDAGRREITSFERRS